MRKRRTRAESSFLKVDQSCLKKVKAFFGMKEKGLIKLAERTIIIGIQEDDASLTEEVEEYFKKLRFAFSNKYRYYLCAEYVLVFQSDVLVDMMPIYGSIRNETQQEYKQRKFTFDELEPHQQSEVRSLTIRSFRVDAGLERGSWCVEHFDLEPEDY